MIKKNAVLFGPEQVDYGEAPTGEQCTNCRFFSAESYDDLMGPGQCQLVYGEVMGNMGCKKFEINPSASDPEDPVDEPDEGMDPDNPDEPMNDDENEHSKRQQPAPVPNIRVLAKNSKKNKSNSRKHADDLKIVELKTKMDMLWNQHESISIPMHRAGSQRAILQRQAIRGELYNLQVTLQNDHNVQYDPSK